MSLRDKVINRPDVNFQINFLIELGYKKVREVIKEDEGVVFIYFARIDRSSDLIRLSIISYEDVFDSVDYQSKNVTYDDFTLYQELIVGV